jgi:uncharacterized OB-fold protein
MDAILHNFYERLKKGIVSGRQCASCRTVAFPPRGLCPGCGSAEAAWVELSGAGTLLFASAGPNLLLGKPYLMATVALREGPIVSGPLLEEFDFTRPEAIWDYNDMNIPVHIALSAHDGGGPIVAFRRAPD